MGEIVLSVLQILLLVCRPTHHSSLEVLKFNMEIQVFKVYKLVFSLEIKGPKTNIIGEHIVSFEKGLIHSQKYKNEPRNKLRNTLTVFKRQIE